MKIAIILVALALMILGGFLAGYKLGGSAGGGDYKIELYNKLVVDDGNDNPEEAIKT